MAEWVKLKIVTYITNDDPAVLRPLFDGAKSQVRNTWKGDLNGGGIAPTIRNPDILVRDVKISGQFDLLDSGTLVREYFQPTDFFVEPEQFSEVMLTVPYESHIAFLASQIAPAQLVGYHARFMTFTRRRSVSPFTIVPDEDIGK